MDGWGKNKIIIGWGVLREAKKIWKEYNWIEKQFSNPRSSLIEHIYIFFISAAVIFSFLSFCMLFFMDGKNFLLPLTLLFTQWIWCCFSGFLFSEFIYIYTIYLYLSVGMRNWIEWMENKKELVIHRGINNHFISCSNTKWKRGFFASYNIL